MRYVAALLLIATIACDSAKRDKEPDVVDTIPPHRIEDGGVPGPPVDAPPATPAESAHYDSLNRGLLPEASIDSMQGTVESPAEEVSTILTADPLTPEEIHLAAYQPVEVPFRVAAAAPDSTVWLKTKVYVKNMKTADRLAYTYYNDTKLLKQNIKKPARDSIQTPAPAYGQTATYKGCVQIWYGGDSTKVFPNEPSCWTWTYTRPAAPAKPPATIDSVVRLVIRTKPEVPGGPYARGRDSLGNLLPVTAANRMQVCGFFQLKDSTWIREENSGAMPVCKELYQEFLTERSG